MRVEPVALEFSEVELGFEFTKAILVYNDGDAPLEVEVSDVLPLSADIGAWNLRETGVATVNPGAPPAIFRQRCAPGGEGVFTTSMLVEGNDLTNPSDSIVMSCEGIPPVPIDAALVLDRSGSMDDRLGATAPRKIEVMQRAASLFVDLLNLRAETVPDAQADKIGLVKYSTANSTYLDLDMAKAGHYDIAVNDKLAPAAVNDMAKLLPDGSTGIGGAMERGAAMLSASPEDRKHVMVVLTDGIENEEPYIDAVLPDITSTDPDLKIYSVGLGPDSQINVGKLQAITNITEGFHQVENDLTGTHIFDLETFYFKIFSNAADMQIAVDPTFSIDVSSPVPVVVDTARMTTSDRSVYFLVLDHPALRSMYNLELIDPNGNVMIVGSDVGGVPIQVQERNNYRVVRVVFPDLAQSHSYVGDWVLRLSPNSGWDPKKIRAALAEHNDPLPGSQGTVSPLQGRVQIGFGAAVASN